MADLDFTHKVDQVSAGAELPKPVQRQMGAEVTGFPDFQSAVNNFAEATNWMSSIGSAVAQKASQAVAQSLGTESGKNPQGDLMPSLTDFDKTYAQSYETQAHYTLGLQANNLITDSNIEMAKAPRITPDLIAKTNQQVSLGLQNIFKNAPAKIRPELEYQYGSQQLAQKEHLTNRMLREQKEDRHNNLGIATKNFSENAYSQSFVGVDLDKNGDSKSGLQAVNAITSFYDSALKTHDATPLEAKVAIDTARQSYLSGKYTRLALIADKEGKLDQFLDDLARKPPSDISVNDHAAVFKNITSYMTNQVSLKSHQENLVSQKMINRIVADPGSITGNDWADFASQVSPLKAEQVRFKLLQAQNKKDSQGEKTNALLANYGDARAHANANPETNNDAFNKAVVYWMKQNPNMTLDDAETEVAKSAGSPPPVHTKIMKDMLWGGNPQNMVAVSKKIDELLQSGNGHALTDLAPEDLALASDIAFNNNPQDPSWSARMIAENKENQDPKVRKASEEVLSSYLYENTKKNNVSYDDFILGKFGFGGGWFHAGFDNPWMKSKYATDILSEFSTNFINTRRDLTRATNLTQTYVDNNFGKTQFNGRSEWSKHPLEKACGFNVGEGINSINKDIVRQLQEPLATRKKLFDDIITDSYWSIEPMNEVSEQNKSNKFYNPNANKPFSILNELRANTEPSFHNRNETSRLQFVKHSREGVVTNTESYPLLMVGNNFNWELNLETADGPISLYLKDPTIGVHQYTPDVDWIRKDYLGVYQSFPNEKFTPILKKLLTPSNEGNE